MVAHRVSAALANRLIADTCEKERIEKRQLTIHADRGTSMTSKLVAQLLADLGVTKTHSRPHVFNDNPYSESHSETLKYRPGFPARFGCMGDARGFCRSFFRWYNLENRHGGIGMMTLEAVHRGRAAAIADHRQHVLDEAYLPYPERFVRGRSRPAPLPAAVWINRPLASEAC